MQEVQGFRGRQPLKFSIRVQLDYRSRALTAIGKVLESQTLVVVQIEERRVEIAKRYFKTKSDIEKDCVAVILPPQLIS